MNNQEAIKAMHNLNMVLSITPSEREAVNMAIAALEEQQSRREWYQKGYADGKKDAENDRWIPVEERLPEVGEKVIVTDISGRVWSDIFTYSFARARDTRPCFNRCDNEYWQCYKPDVIAWQPLPKSYRPEKGDK